jgi:hypothetical protein
VAQDVELDLSEDDEKAGGAQRPPVPTGGFRMHSRRHDGPMQRGCAAAETAEDLEVSLARSSPSLS